MFLTGAEGFQKFARGFFYFFIAIFPFLLYKGFIFSGTTTRGMNLIILIEILAVMLGFALLNKKNGIKILKSPITLSLGVLLLSLIVSSILGVDFATSFWSKITRMTGLYYFLHLGLFYFFVTMLFAETKNLRTLLKVFVISGAIFSIASLLAKDGFSLIFANTEWQGFTFGNSTFAAMYLYAAFMAGIYHIYSMEKSDRRWWHFLLVLSIVINPYLINIDIFRGGSGIIGGAQASSYAMFFSIIMLAGALAISKIKILSVRRGAIWGSVILGLVIGVSAIHSLLVPGGALQEEYLKQASSARPMAWALSQKAIFDHPTFGWGVDNIGRAVEKYYDNRVMEKANGGEAWFDRAHNVFVDQTVESGYVGTIIYILTLLTVIGSMLYVIFKSTNKNDQAFAVIIIIYFIGHLMEIQTAFDTTISYVPLAMMAAFATLLFHRTYKNRVQEKSEWIMPKAAQFAKGALLIAVFGTLFVIGTVPILKANLANGAIRVAGSSEKRMPIYPALFGSPSDAAGFLNRTFTDLKRGISLTTELLENPKKVEGFKTEFALLTTGFEEYVETHPHDYRARINLVDLYIYQRLFNVDHLVLAHQISDEAIALVPQAPQAYWQKSVAYLYQRKFPEAKEWAKKAYDLNPNIEQSQHLMKYIEESIKTFPNIELYNFLML